MSSWLHQHVRQQLQTTTATSNTTEETALERSLHRQLVQQVLAACKKKNKCPHCGAYNPKIRSVDHNKFFQEQLSAKQQRHNTLEGIHIQSALKESTQQGGNESDHTDIDMGDDEEESDEDDEEPLIIQLMESMFTRKKTV